MAAPKKGVLTAPTKKRRTREEIESETGYLCNGLYLRVAALRHRWDQLQATAFKTGHVELRSGEDIPLNSDRAAEIRAIAARWGLDVAISRAQLNLPWTLAFTRKTDWQSYTRGKIRPVAHEEGDNDPNGTHSSSSVQGERKPTMEGCYARIDACLAALLDQTDAILGGTDDRRDRPSIAREIYRRLGNAGQVVMEKCAACEKDLKENP